MSEEETGSQSPLFKPYRVLGCIADSIPVVCQRLGQETFITVSVGKGWQLYRHKNLRLALVGEDANGFIQDIATKKELTFTAVDKKIYVYQRAKIVHQAEGHLGNITKLLCFGDVLISAGLDNRIFIWNIVSERGQEADDGLGGGRTYNLSEAGSIHLAKTFIPTSLVHPSTYLDKILVGGSNGAMQLWNIRTLSLIYEFKGWGSSILCLENSPALDVVGVGLADGRVILHNLRYDEIVESYEHGGQTSGKRAACETTVTSISFRTDGAPNMAIGGSDGHISVWNLAKRSLSAFIENAHEAASGGVSNIQFFQGEPLLLSSGGDNAIQQWIFDAEDGSARLLRQRAGHKAPITRIRFYGESGHTLLSASKDRSLRIFSTTQDHQSSEITQKNTIKKSKKLGVPEEELKLPILIDMAFSEARERDWCNLLTCHEGDSCGYTWRLKDRAIGEHVLKPKHGYDPENAVLRASAQKTAVTAVSVSQCGNFGFIALGSGHVERFNLQSGSHRGVLSDPQLSHGRAHSKPVCGIQCDGGNQVVATCASDGFVKLFDFKSRKVRSRVSIDSTISFANANRGAFLLGIACADYSVRVIDMLSAKSVRVYRGHEDRVNDLAFSDDNKWVLSCSMDSTLRVWDLLSATCLGVMSLDSPAVSISLSPQSDILATVHIEESHIRLWANVSIFGSGDTLPVLDQMENGSKEEELDLESINQEDVTALGPNLVTLGLSPHIQWASLLHLDSIKARNKPVEPLKKPERAPFFLDALAAPNDDASAALISDAHAQVDKDSGRQSKKLKTQISQDSAERALADLLRKFESHRDIQPLVKFFKSRTVTKIELELLQLGLGFSLEENEQQELLGLFMDFLTTALQSACEFELIQGMLAAFLKIHGQAIAQNEELRKKASEMASCQKLSWSKLEVLGRKAKAMLQFFINYST